MRLMVKSARVERWYMKKYPISVWCGLISVSISVVATVIAISGAASLRLVAPGTVVPSNAMREYFLAGIVGFLLGAALGFPLAILAGILGRKRPIAWLAAAIALTMSLAPGPAGGIVGRYFISHNNLEAGR